MRIEVYRRIAKEILLENVDRRFAYQKFLMLLIIYSQDGALAGEKYYGNNMIAKGKILCDLSIYFMDFELKGIKHEHPKTNSK